MFEAIEGFQVVQKHVLIGEDGSIR